MHALIFLTWFAVVSGSSIKNSKQSDCTKCDIINYPNQDSRFCQGCDISPRAQPNCGRFQVKENPGSAPQSRGPFSAVADNDNTFVYSRSQCRHYAQQIISAEWISACSRAIFSLCSLLRSNETTDYNAWSWSWSSSNGSTCQAGLFQPYHPVNSPLRPPLSEECCTSNFQAMMSARNVTARSNRISVNVAENGFPGGFFIEPTTSSLKGSLNGKQVNTGLPSYILQGYVALRDNVICDS